MTALNCTKCKYNRPRCEKGKKLSAKMTRRLLNNNLKMDATHRKLWREYVNHTEK